MEAESSGINERVYKCMLKNTTSLEIERSAIGLHHAIRELREKTRKVEGIKKVFPSNAIIWAPYIHVGV
jgi:hypothetical protein